MMPLADALNLSNAPLLGSAGSSAPPGKFILDTDIYQDSEDTWALHVANVLMDQGKGEIVGIGVTTNFLACAAAADSIQQYFNRTSPIWLNGGSVPGNIGDSSHTTALQYGFPNRINSSADTTEFVAGITAYLTSATEKVTLISIGGLINFSNLLSSSGGSALIASRVKALWIMGGNSSGTGPSPEYNFGIYPSAAANVATNWPSSVPVYYTEFPLGEGVVSGQTMLSATPKTDPSNAAFSLFCTQYSFDPTAGRNSWDELCVWLAMEGVEGTDYALQEGSNAVNSSTGTNVWTPGSGTNQWQVSLLQADAYYAAKIITLQTAAPANPYTYPSLSGEVSRWNFNETSGATAHDSVGSNNATLQGNASFTTDDSLGALNLETAGSYATVPYSSSLQFANTDNFAMACWIKTPSSISSGYNAVLQQGRDDGTDANQWIGLFINPDTPKIITFTTDLNSAFSQSGSTFFTLQPSTRYHLCGVQRNGVTLLYINGIPQNQVGGAINNTLNEPWTFGGYLSDGGTPGQQFFGLLEQVRVLKSTILTGQVQDLMANLP